ncbi:vacuolar ATPase assembly integral membrane protein vma21 [Vermiconidia calcicola]|uniref:Vacuolar ATPase assembly integral membrane protein vma21 n=1 Tax=Vermiconidia calcicola TaxID=1690605 RepID=A0ACC3NMG6_9PEZI|nr:vacuolar ATPase assembly integral membrane protein vma21 [Vermiconidia calcicola]
MATRRIATNEKTHLDQDDIKNEPRSNISPEVPSSVIAKLLAFTAAMIVAPLSSYFLSINKLFGGNSTYAGAFAAFIANMVLIGYVIVAFRDDQQEREADEAEKKKSR